MVTSSLLKTIQRLKKRSTPSFDMSSPSMPVVLGRINEGTTGDAEKKMVAVKANKLIPILGWILQLTTLIQEVA